MREKNREAEREGREAQADTRHNGGKKKAHSMERKSPGSTGKGGRKLREKGFPKSASQNKATARGATAAVSPAPPPTLHSPDPTPPHPPPVPEAASTTVRGHRSLHRGGVEGIGAGEDRISPPNLTSRGEATRG